MQLLVLQCLQRTAVEAQPGHAPPARPQSRYPAHLAASETDLLLSRCLTVLFALTSRVTVDGLTPMDEAILLALQDSWSPRATTSLWSMVSCLLDLPVISASSSLGRGR